jgi:hypothetical protein
MSTINELLREADPLHDDWPRLEAERGRLRHAVVSAATRAPAGSGGRFHARRTALVTVAALLVTVAAMRWQNWTGGGATLQAAMRFEVRLAEERPIPGLVATPVAGTTRVVYLYDGVLVTNGDIVQSRVTDGGGPARFGIEVTLSPAGAERMRRATATHIGRPVAILIDGNVVALPVVRAPIGESAVISGDFTRADAERIAEGIRLP